MLISLCIPVHNRTYDLKRTMPRLLDAANLSPPVEIVVIDYHSKDDLRGYMKRVIGADLEENNSITYKRYTGRDYYHMAHARNLSVLAAHGKWFVILSADIYITPDFLPYVRERITPDYFLFDEKYKGVIVCQRDEFIAAGGYDERFEFYGPEDRELHDRLVRRGVYPESIPAGMVEVYPTPNDIKVLNYRLPLSKWEMHTRGLEVLRESRDKGTLVANQEGWGKWE